MIGSISTGCACSIASLKAIEPAILNAISEESTEWCWPSKSVHAHVLDRVAGDRAGAHRLEDALLDGRDEAARDHAALDRVHELEARRRARSGSISMWQSANWPRPPVCFL